jgi:hypothetical protein
MALKDYLEYGAAGLAGYLYHELLDAASGDDSSAVPYIFAGMAALASVRTIYRVVHDANNAVVAAAHGAQQRYNAAHATVAASINNTTAAATQAFTGLRARMGVRTGDNNS